MAGGRQGFAAVAEQNLTVLDKQELVQIEIGSGQVTKGGPLSYLAIKRSHILNGRHVLLCSISVNSGSYLMQGWTKMSPVYL